MQGAPQGFNPSDSLIPRVQADIIGVQGGGGSMMSLGWLSEVKNISFQNVGADGKLSAAVKVAAPVVAAPVLSTNAPPTSRVSGTSLSRGAAPAIPTSALSTGADPGAVSTTTTSTADANLGAVSTTTTSTADANLGAATTIPTSALSTTAQTQQTQLRDPKYIQKQEGLGCGRHALNNLFGFTYFTKDVGVDITDTNIDKLTPPIALAKLCSYLEEKNIVQEVLCKQNEDYDASVLMAALAVIGHNSERISDKELFDTTDNKYIYPDVLGYIINLGEATIKGTNKNIINHWTALRIDSDTQVTYYDSIGPKTETFTSSLKGYLIKKYGNPSSHKWKAFIKVYNHTAFIDPLQKINEIRLGAAIEELGSTDVGLAKASGFQAINKNINGFSPAATQTRFFLENAITYANGTADIAAFVSVADNAIPNTWDIISKISEKRMGKGDFLVEVNKYLADPNNYVLPVVVKYYIGDVITLTNNDTGYDNRFEIKVVNNPESHVVLNPYIKEKKMNINIIKEFNTLGPRISESDTFKQQDTEEAAKEKEWHDRYDSIVAMNDGEEINIQNTTEGSPPILAKIASIEPRKYLGVIKTLLKTNSKIIYSYITPVVKVKDHKQTGHGWKDTVELQSPIYSPAKKQKGFLTPKAATLPIIKSPSTPTKSGSSSPFGGLFGKTAKVSPLPSPAGPIKKGGRRTLRKSKRVTP